jgi:hypothetical protein
MDFKLGKKEYVHDDRTLQLHELLRTEQVHAPSTFDFDSGRKAFPRKVWGNDEYGDCVLAGRANHLLRLGACRDSLHPTHRGRAGNSDLQGNDGLPSAGRQQRQRARRPLCPTGMAQGMGIDISPAASPERTRFQLLASLTPKTRSKSGRPTTSCTVSSTACGCP